MSKKKTVFGARGIISIVVVVAVFALFFMLWKGKKETIKIGAILSLSGSAGDVGQEARDGMLLAIEEVNSRGGINGKKIELIIEDSKTNLQEGKEAFDKIEKAHHPVLYLSMLSSVSMALAPLAEEHEVVLVALLTAVPQLTKQKEWVFRYWPTAEIEIPPILSILEELKVKKLGILYLNDEYGRSVSRLLKKGFERTGGMTKAEAYDLKETDFKEQITKLKDTEAIYVAGFSSYFENVFKQLKDENFRGFVFASMGTVDYPVRNMPEAQGVYVTPPIIYEPDFFFTREAKEKYEAKYDKTFNHRVANGYDFIKLLAGLLEDEEISREGVKRVLEEGFIYYGVFGSLGVKAGEHDISFPLYPAQIVDGKVQYR